ncbi:TubC N-terminal docking domain-related protein [Paraburkholderia terrae]|uniref:TubC N-terminal docking domain-related protein n=1 Tax=Paraburkholderia terrae TaxID=311230 RepID=UPI00296B2531|nr:hypothetical protein [Paraburkholderia terrae]MDW3660380.1 hypothetical protein [Paraburkholderia terrae]
MTAAAQIVSKAHAMGVRLWLDGDRVNFAGPASAVAAIRSDLAAHKPEIVAHLRAGVSDQDSHGALIDADSGGLYLPWGACLPAEDVHRMRDELASLIVTLAEIEGWRSERLDDVMRRAMRGPLADLLPNLHHFREQLLTERAATALCSRAWRGEGLDARHYCPGCSGECVGTRRSCKRGGR